MKLIRNIIPTIGLVSLLTGCGEDRKPTPSGEVPQGFQIHRQPGVSAYTAMHLNHYRDASGVLYEKVTLVDVGSNGSVDRVAFLPGPTYVGEQAREWQSLYDSTLRQLVK